MKTTSHRNLTRRQAMCLAATGVLVGTGLLSGRTYAAARPDVRVYKSPECGCCGLWSKELRQNGFRVTVVETDDLDPVKRLARVPEDLETCHTAFIDGYVVEGHVPVAAIDKLLAERPKVIGIGVPGMPAGSPGMPSVEREPFDVIAFAADGRLTRFMSFR